MDKRRKREDHGFLVLHIDNINLKSLTILI